MKIFLNVKKLKLEMARNGFNITMFADKVGVTKQYMGYVLKGNSCLSAKTASKIARVLKLEFEDLFEVK